MTNLEQIIIEKVHTFPPEKQQKILDYAESLEEIKQEAHNETLWDMVKDLVEQVPKEAWDELPTDGSINVDHYLYGHKKKTK
jgi:FPC/CPF motif-containing protein YcgG